MELLDLAKFDPNVEVLNALVAESAGIVEVDINDPTQIERVKTARIKLRDARVLITKTGKSYRQSALDYQRAVIAKEDSLIAIIEPEERRLKEFEEKAKREKELAIRRAQLPERMERLTKVGVTLTEEEVMTLDSVQFETKLNELIAKKNQLAAEDLDRQRQAAQRAITEARIARLKAIGLIHGPANSMQFVIDHTTLATFTMGDITAPEDIFEAKVVELVPFVEQKRAEAEEKARKRKEEDDDRTRQKERERIETEKKQEDERKERERKEVERKKAYQKFLIVNGVTKENVSDFKQDHQADGSVVLWKRVAIFKKSS